MPSALPTVLYIPSIYTEHEPEEWESFSKFFNVLIYDCQTPEEFIKRLQPGGQYHTIDAIMRPSWLKAPPYQNHHLFRGQIVDHFPPSLKIIVSGGHGYDVVDVDRLTDRGIWFCNSPNTCTEATGEGSFPFENLIQANTVLYLILSAYRYFTFAEHCIRSGKYAESRRLGPLAEDPSGQILGIIGLGHIGVAVAQRVQAIGMQVHYYSPTRKLTAERKLGGVVYHQSLESILSVADCICLSCPYTPRTHHMLGTKEFSVMKNGVRIVNIARGALIDEEALVEAIDNGRVAAVGLDVHEHEPEVHPRLKENYMTTLLPHIGVCSKTSWRNFERNCRENLEAYFYGDGIPSTPVNHIGRKN